MKAMRAAAMAGVALVAVAGEVAAIEGVVRFSVPAGTAAEPVFAFRNPSIRVPVGKGAAKASGVGRETFSPRVVEDDPAPAPKAVPRVAVDVDESKLPPLAQAVLAKLQGTAMRGGDGLGAAGVGAAAVAVPPPPRKPAGIDVAEGEDGARGPAGEVAAGEVAAFADVGEGWDGEGIGRSESEPAEDLVGEEVPAGEAGRQQVGGGDMAGTVATEPPAELGGEVVGAGTPGGAVEPAMEMGGEAEGGAGVGGGGGIASLGVAGAVLAGFWAWRRRRRPVLEGPAGEGAGEEGGAVVDVGGDGGRLAAVVANDAWLVPGREMRKVMAGRGR